MADRADMAGSIWEMRLRGWAGRFLDLEAKFGDAEKGIYGPIRDYEEALTNYGILQLSSPRNP